MSKVVKILWSVCGFFFLFLIGARYLYGGWSPVFWVPFGICLITCIFALALNFKFYIEFLTLKTTQRGMSMGVSLLLLGLFVLAVNFIAVSQDQIWDLTDQKIHSLSVETKKVVQSIQDPIRVFVFYRGQKDAEARERIRNLVQIYQEENAQISVTTVDAYVKRTFTEQKLKDLGARVDEMVVVLQKGDGPVVRVLPPLNEKTLTMALIKVSRTEAPAIYFTRGHAEKHIDSKEPSGLYSLAQSLRSLSFQLREFVLKKGIPNEAKVIAVIGPRLPFKKSEIAQLKKFLKNGGSLFLGLDPKDKHNLGHFLLQYGVRYKNNYIINRESQLVGRGPSGALGLEYSRRSSITTNLGTPVLTVFDVASELVLKENSSVRPLIKSSPNSMSVNLINTKSNPTDTQARVIGAEVPRKDEAQSFHLVVFGDSDFLSEKDIIQGSNRNLALNIFSALAEEENLVVFRKDHFKGDTLILLDSHLRVWSLSFWFMTVVFFGSAIVFTIRKKIGV